MYVIGNLTIITIPLYATVWRKRRSLCTLDYPIIPAPFSFASLLSFFIRVFLSLRSSLYTVALAAFSISYIYRTYMCVCVCVLWLLRSTKMARKERKLCRDRDKKKSIVPLRVPGPCATTTADRAPPAEGGVNVGRKGGLDEEGSSSSGGSECTYVQGAAAGKGRKADIHIPVAHQTPSRIASSYRAITFLRRVVPSARRNINNCSDSFISYKEGKQLCGGCRRRRPWPLSTLPGSFCRTFWRIATRVDG